LNSAARHAANAAAYDWPRASARRDYMVNRASDAQDPDDSSHVTALEAAGATTVRGTARIVGPGRVEVRHEDAIHELAGRNIVIAVGSTTKVPPIEGIEHPDLVEPRGDSGPRAAASLLVLGGGRLAASSPVFARFGVPTTIVQSGRLTPTTITQLGDDRGRSPSG
jgi:pyruvate/2-oxoglutarate dehydrogenase complex dihydrolipoamide dehydrogenase (E3) component